MKRFSFSVVLHLSLLAFPLYGQPAEPKDSAQKQPSRTPTNSQPGSAAQPDQRPSQGPTNPRSPRADPHRLPGQQAAQPKSVPDPSLPGDVLVVSVVGSHGKPVKGVTVVLQETLQSIAKGNQEATRRATTGADGRARFENLDTSLKNSYSTQVTYDGAVYEVPPFRNVASSGHRITIPVFPSTPDPHEALVGLRGFVYITLREGQFAFDVLYRVFSMGKKTWIPQSIVLDLPAGAQAIQPAKENPGFVADSGKVRLEGNYPPGQKDIRFTFHVPSENEETKDFSLDLPPNVAEIRVLVEKTPNMELRVRGFEPVQQAAGPKGNQVLVTRKVTKPGTPSPQTVTIQLFGLPVTGPERWYVVAAAGLLAAMGLGGALFSRKTQRDREERADREQARQLILDDLVLLEKSHQGGEIGPETYDQARRQLIFALARLEDDAGSPSAT